MPSIRTKTSSVRKNKKTKRIKNRFNKTRRQKTQIRPKIIVIGKIYSISCFHCQMLEPEWNKMRENISNNNSKNKNIIIVDIEQENQDNLILDINNKYLNSSINKLALQEGYPTIFKIENGGVNYYNGQRDADSMIKWFLL